MSSVPYKSSLDVGDVKQGRSDPSMLSSIIANCIDAVQRVCASPPNTKFQISKTSAIFNFNGYFDTNYWEKFQIFAIIWCTPNLVILKFYFVLKWPEMVIQKPVK